MNYLYCLCELARISELNEKLVLKQDEMLSQIRRATSEPQVILILQEYNPI